MGAPIIETTRPNAWPVGTSPAHLEECRKVALEQQHELLEGAQQRMTAWIGRRQEALETGLDAFKRMSACRTPVEVAVIYGEWLSGSMTRIFADLEAGQAHTIEVAEHFQKASKTLFAPPQGPAEPAGPAESHQPAATGEQSQKQLREAA